MELKKRDGYQIIDGKQTDREIHKEINDREREQQLIDEINKVCRTIKN